MTMINGQILYRNVDLEKKNVLIAIIMYSNFLTFYIASLFLEL